MYCIIVPAQIIANILMPEIPAAMRHCIVRSVLPVEQIQPNAAVQDALFIWMGEPIPILAAVQKNSGDKGTRLMEQKGGSECETETSCCCGYS